METKRDGVTGAKVSQAIALAAVICGCAGQAPTVEPLRVGAPADPSLTEIRDPFPETATWRLHPIDFLPDTTPIALPDGSQLYLAGGGQRWVTSTPKNTSARTSIHRAPESLRQAVATPTGKLYMLGHSGIVYESKTPLGPIDAESAAPEHLMAIAAIESRVFAVGIAGTLFRYEAGSWKQVASPAPLFDLVSRGPNQLVGLGFPEQLWSSRDGAETWSPIDAPGIGAIALRADNEQTIRAVGVTRSLQYDGQAIRPAPPEKETISPPAQRGPSGQALIDRRAVIDGGTYLEALEFETGRWRLLSGFVGGPIEPSTTRLPTEKCHSVRLGASGGQLVFACIRGSDERIEVHLFHRGKPTEAWSTLPVMFARDGRAIGITMQGDRTFWINGVCSKPTCTPRTPILIRGKRVQVTRAPELAGSAGRISLDPQRQRAYFLGRRRKDQAVALFVSDDTRQFSARSLGLRAPSANDGRWTLKAANDGMLSVTIHAPQTPLRYALLDDKGRVLLQRDMPSSAVAVAAEGRDLMLLSRRSKRRGEPRQALLSISRDAGRNFSEIDLAPPLAYDELASPAATFCNADICIIGDSLSRLSWRRAPDADQPETLASRRLTEPRQIDAVPLQCEVNDTAPWTHLEHLHQNRGPSALRAMQGGSAWSVLRHNKRNGHVQWLSMPVNGKELQKFDLLKPVNDRSKNDISVAPQMEGYAAARIQRAKRGSTIHVGWVNAMTDTRATAQLALDPTWQLDSQLRPSLEKTRWRPEWMSVSPQVLLMKPSMKRDTTISIAPDGKWTSVGAYPKWPSLTGGWQTHSDAVQVNGSTLAMGMTHRRSDSTVLLAQRLTTTGPDDLTATGIAPPHLAPRSSTTQWTYRGHQVGVLASIRDAKQTHGIMYFAPFKANGTLGPVRTLSPPAQLATHLEPCSEDARRRTTRVVHPIARRRSVTVTLPGRTQPIALESHYGVFYGDATACLAAWTARAPSRRDPFRAQIDARGRGWLFRTHAGGVAFRPMTCRPRSGSLGR